MDDPPIKPRVTFARDAVKLMKAMVLERIAPIETSPLKLTELPEPEPEAGQVRLKVHSTAICRTDLHVIEGDLGC